MLVGTRPKERHVTERVIPEPAHGVALRGHPVLGCEDCLVQQVDSLLPRLRGLRQIVGAPSDLVERKRVDVPLRELGSPLVGLHRMLGVAHAEVELTDHEVGLRQVL